MSSTSAKDCFHCGEPLRSTRFFAQLPQGPKPVCCAGCKAVAETIAAAGLTDFYSYRNGPSGRPAVISPVETGAGRDDTWTVYDQPRSLETLSRINRAPNGELQREVTILLSGMQCAACAWLVDRVLKQLPGVIASRVNAATGRALVSWDPSRVQLSTILRSVAALGYAPHPVGATAATDAARDERRAALKRLAVSGFGMMQVMMFAVALYFGAAGGMDERLERYLRLSSLLVCVPVMLYAGWPFLRGAWTAVRARTVSMDVPVSVALVLAFGASVANSLTNTGEVYFDSVTMFVFFLTLGRFMEMTARHRTGSVTDALARLTPAIAHRMEGGRIEDVPVAALRAGDRVLVRPGESLPADGYVASGTGRCDESLLTGESQPLARRPGDAVIAGAILMEGPLEVHVSATGEATVLSGVIRLLDRAQAAKPRLQSAADRTAAWFLSRILVGAAGVGLIWLLVDPDRALAATLAVLVVTCPCALSLATPAAISAATAGLARKGILVTGPDAIEALASADVAVFDKTGTLTQGVVRVAHCETLGSMGEAPCRELAALLERGSEHPLARAFAGGHRAGVGLNANVEPGKGVEAVVAGSRYRIGQLSYVAGLLSDQQAATLTASMTDEAVVLGNEHELLAAFRLEDSLRPNAADAVAALRTAGLDVTLLSGDSTSAVAATAGRCGIGTWLARQAPADKLAYVDRLIRQGRKVLMVGDGINDAPVLGGATVAIAMGRGSALAQASADLVLINDDLAAVPLAIAEARRTMRVMRQNLAWAAAYNFCALPLAALGFVPPWAASIGMALSSALVVVNALRLAPPGASQRGHNRSVPAVRAMQSPASIGAGP